MKIDLVVPDHHLEEVVTALVKSARTGKIGDGRVFVMQIDEAIHIRTKEKGESLAAS